jgi:hypothetical protein
MPKSKAQNRNFLKNLLRDNPQKFETISKNPKKFEIQIIYTQINRDKNNIPTFKTYTYKTKKKEYFYPASTIKLPLSLLALEKINQLKIKELTKFSPFFVKQNRKPQTEAFKDTTKTDSIPNIAHYIKKIFLVSDNDASNRLYEFLGQGYINETMRKKDYKRSVILHRLAAPEFNEEDNKYTNALYFTNENKQVIYEQNEVYQKRKIKQRANRTKKGKAYFNGNYQKIEKPLSFERRNFFSLNDMHQVLKATFFPASLPPKNRFQLNQEDYQFLWKTMATLPKESGIKCYENLPDNYAKYYFGSSENEPKEIPKNIKIFNKVGMAYGYLIDNAYIIDTEKNIEFMLSVVLYTNENNILNDNKYEYDTIAFPFMKNIFQTIYDFEIQRKRKFMPNLEEFKLLFQE